MNQETLNKLQLSQKTETKHIYFKAGNNNSNFSGTSLVVYDNGNINGDLNLAQFPNLVKITFGNSIKFSNLNSIDISENNKLCWLIIDSRYANFRDASYCRLFAKESQIDRVILSYIDASGNPRADKLRNQCQIPYYLAEGQKLEQLEAEVENLRQVLAEKDQQVKDLQTETKRKPTLYQFQELNKILLPGSKLNYIHLKEEIKRLKLKDFAPYFQQKKEKYDQLTTNCKDKAGDNLKAILELFLQTRKQIIVQSNINDNDFAKGQLYGQVNTCQALLQSKFTQEEIESLSSKHDEMLKLEEQLDNI
ncbi:536_t:CDS:2 [Acaulospora colombiana]|uniref:536_t:CDS:1 n=1 Tax=Acaulospora colombiana TaxID=27376 RepID=A0ACA9K774_9GLOM|nr:536_t:CDS:2 [Acaulospora colombiana]